LLLTDELICITYKVLLLTACTCTIFARLKLWVIFFDSFFKALCLMKTSFQRHRLAKTVHTRRALATMSEKPMSRILIILLIIGLYSCGDKQKSEKKTETVTFEQTVSELKDFELLQDFKKNKAEFGTPDSFELNDHSSDGGELKVFHDKDFDYIVFDFWLYGETGKLNYTYWTDKNGNLEFKFVKKLNFVYDKPYYEENFKIDSTINYLSYSGKKIRMFDLNRNEIQKAELIDSTKNELESFFKDVTKGIEIIK